jgi:hypothetical protein
LDDEGLSSNGGSSKSDMASITLSSMEKTEQKEEDND